MREYTLAKLHGQELEQRAAQYRLRMSLQRKPSMWRLPMLTILLGLLRR